MVHTGRRTSWLLCSHWAMLDTQWLIQYFKCKPSWMHSCYHEPCALLRTYVASIETSVLRQKSRCGCHYVLAYFSEGTNKLILLTFTLGIWQWGCLSIAISFCLSGCVDNFITTNSTFYRISMLFTKYFNAIKVLSSWVVQNTVQF